MCLLRQHAIMCAPAPPTKPTLHHGPPRPIPRELRAKRDDEVREESSIVWRAEDAARQALLRSQPLIRRLKHKAEAAMHEVKSTYALLFGERERETGEVEAVRKSLGKGDHFHVSEVLYHALEQTLETNERLSRMPPRFHEEVAIDVADAVRKKIEKGSRVAPAPDDEEPESVAVDVYRNAVLNVVNARPAPPQKPRAKVLRFSPVLRVCVYDNVDTLTNQEWCSSTDIVYNKRLAAALQRKLGGRRRRRWVEGDEARLAQDAGFASVEAWVDGVNGRPPPPASPFSCLRSRKRAPADD